MGDQGKLQEKKEGLRQVLAKLDKLCAACEAKLASRDGSSWNQAEADRLNAKLLTLKAEREHLLYQFDELERGLIFLNSSIRNGVVQPADSKQLLQIETGSFDDKRQLANLSGRDINQELAESLLVRSIRTLCLSRCQLKEIPKEVFQIAGLQSLDLSRNKIENIPAELSSLQQLTYLSLHENSIKSASPGWTDGFSLLKTLVLSNNQLSGQEFAQEQQEASSLLQISLSYNHLTSIPPFILVHCRSLKKLYVDHNKIDQLPTIEAFSTMKYLSHLCLQNNNIRSVESLNKLPSLIALNISWNLLQKEPLVQGQCKVFAVEGNPYLTSTKGPQEAAEAD